VENLDTVREDWLRQIASAGNADALEQLRVSILGRNGQLTALLKTLGGLAPDERKARGAALNQLKGAVEEAIGAAKQSHDRAALDQRLKEERIDITLPVKADIDGRVHPISQTIDELIAIFGEMGFTVAEGPHIEDDFHNFTALNIPPEHPARQEHDTFYLMAAAKCCARIHRRSRSAR
jgi:phenylalanyl-tRNA synthetase alpha chain